MHSPTIGERSQVRTEQNEMSARTVYAKAVPAGEVFESIDWRPWLKVEDSARDWFPQLVLNWWIRRRGGVHRGERLTVTVYTYDDRAPTHANGKPKKCLSTQFVINHKDNPAEAVA